MVNWQCMYCGLEGPGLISQVGQCGICAVSYLLAGIIEDQENLQQCSSVASTPKNKTYIMPFLEGIGRGASRAPIFYKACSVLHDRGKPIALLGTFQTLTDIEEKNTLCLIWNSNPGPQSVGHTAHNASATETV